jgi:hypothetical protein
MDVSSQDFQVTCHNNRTPWLQTKKQIADMVGIEHESCRFLHRGKELHDKLKDVFSCGIERGDMILLYERKKLSSIAMTELDDEVAQSTLATDNARSEQSNVNIDELGVLVADHVCTTCKRNPRTLLCTRCGCGSCGKKDDDENVVCDECEVWYHFVSSIIFMDLTPADIHLDVS